MSRAAPASTDRLRLAEQARRVALRPHYEDLAAAAVEVHLVGNDGSDERWQTEQTDRERARMGYRAELAVAQFYDLTPDVSYLPPTVGDPGFDFRVEHARHDRPVTVDVKATTTTDPPMLYLTRKREWHERYRLPDYYLLASEALTEDDAVHLLGWVSCDRLREEGEETAVHGNPVWRLPALALEAVPAPETLTDLGAVRRRLHAAADAAEGEVPLRETVAEWTGGDA